MLVFERGTTKINESNVCTKGSAVILGAPAIILSVRIAIIGMHEKNVFRLEIGVDELHTMAKTNSLDQLSSKTLHVFNREAQMIVFFAKIIERAAQFLKAKTKMLLLAVFDFEAGQETHT